MLDDVARKPFQRMVDSDLNLQEGNLVGWLQDV